MSFSGIVTPPRSLLSTASGWPKISKKTGLIYDRSNAADYDDDMKQAKAAGTDGFALNIGIDSLTNIRLDFAFKSGRCEVGRGRRV